MDPDVEQMSRKDLMRRMESTLHMYKTSKYSDLKKTSSMISLTTDIWAASNRKPFSKVTAHYIDSESSLQSDSIAFVRLPFPHPGEHLAACLEDIIETSGIGEKVSSVTTDNALNNVKALQLMMSNTRLSYSKNLVHIRCLSHVFDLVVRDTMTGLNDDISAVRTLMNFLWHPKQDQLLSETARRLNEVYVKPLVDVETRWNSIYDMLQRALKLKPCISLLVRHHKDCSELGTADLS
ncbi:putative AC9 transposase [Halotydeus destructor]|nr:putative AC9 transposase [Halotydeus destructor]